MLSTDLEITADQDCNDSDENNVAAQDATARARLIGGRH